MRTRDKDIMCVEYNDDVSIDEIIEICIEHNIEHQVIGGNIYITGADIHGKINNKPLKKGNVLIVWSGIDLKMII